MMLLSLWLGGALTTLLAYAAVSYWHDRHLVLSCWIGLWLTVMLLLGPIGTCLTLRFLWLVNHDVRREARLQRGRLCPQP